MDSLQRWLTLVTLVSAALAATIYLTRQTWRAFKAMERVSLLLTHELSPNSGTSMKDDVAAIAVAVGQLQADVSDLTSTKDRAHQLLQLQIDSLIAGEQHPRGQHKAGGHKREDME